jgi:hypothetical protein
MLKNSYPNLIYNNKCDDTYKQIFNYFFENFREDTKISSIAIKDDNTFIIKNSNNIIGGANYLSEFEDTRKSNDDKYNDLIKSINKEDEILSIGKINFCNLFI